MAAPKCPKCDEAIVYVDRWFKKCRAGHLSEPSEEEKAEFERQRGVEK